MAILRLPLLIVTALASPVLGCCVASHTAVEGDADGGLDASDGGIPCGTIVCAPDQTCCFDCDGNGSCAGPGGACTGYYCPPPKDGGDVDAAPPPSCALLHPSEPFVVRVPVIAFSDEPIVITVHHGSWCGAHDGSATAAVSGSQISVNAFACDGCEACACVGSAFTNTIVLSPLAAGDYDVVWGTWTTSATTLVVRDRAVCVANPAGPTSVEVVDPALGTGVYAGEPVLWVRAAVPVCRCCIPAELGLIESRWADEIDLAAVDCAPPEPCDCACVPAPVDTWRPLRGVGTARWLVVNGTRVALP